MSLGLTAKFEIWWMARTLPLRVAGKNMTDLAALIEVAPAQQFQAVEIEELSKRIVSTTRKPWLMRDRRCLRQGLLGMWFFRKAGLDPVLRFGIDAGSIAKDRLSAHCWVEIDGKPVLNDKHENMFVIHTLPEERPSVTDQAEA